MSDALSFLCNCATPTTIERLARERGFVVFRLTIQPSLCCAQTQIHGYVDNPEDDFDGTFGYLTPGHRTFDYTGRNGLHATRARRAKDEHFDSYSWFRLGNLKGFDLRQLVQYEDLALSLPTRFGY